jgi:hypothetical protein
MQTCDNLQIVGYCLALIPMFYDVLSDCMIYNILLPMFYDVLSDCMIYNI